MINKKKILGWLPYIVIVGAPLWWSIYGDGILERYNTNILMTQKDELVSRAEKYLEDTYGEEFFIDSEPQKSLFVANGKIYEVTDTLTYYESNGVPEFHLPVYPKKYIGTEKVNDDYYTGSIVLYGNGYRKIEDNYAQVALNVSANEFYREKAEEIFGKNIRLVLRMTGEFEHTDYKEEIERRKTIDFKADLDSPRPIKTLRGGIYIYDDIDKEDYQKKVGGFIQYMKDTDTFDYVFIRISLIDPRVLTKEFKKDKELKLALIDSRYDLDKFDNKEKLERLEWAYYQIENGKTKRGTYDFRFRDYNNDDEFIESRKKLMDNIKMNLTPEEMYNEIQKINVSIAFKKEGSEYRGSYFNSPLATRIVSPKLWKEVPFFDDEKDYNEFNKMDNIKLIRDNHKGAKW